MLNRAARILSTAAIVGALTVLAAGCAAGGTSGETAEGAPTSVIGAWGSEAKGQPNLTFTDEGTVFGTDGCNGISSTYKTEGDLVTVDRFASTLMACQGVDTWLSGLSTVAVDGDKLVVKNAAGAQIGELKRTDG